MKIFKKFYFWLPVIYAGLILVRVISLMSAKGYGAMGATNYNLIRLNPYYLYFITLNIFPHNSLFIIATILALFDLAVLFLIGAVIDKIIYKIEKKNT